MNTADTFSLCVQWDVTDFFPVKLGQSLLPSREGEELLELTAEDGCAPPGKGAAYVKVPMLRCENCCASRQVIPVRGQNVLICRTTPN